MVLVVKYVEEGGQERVKILDGGEYTDLKQTTVVYGSRTYVDDREFLENGTELFVKRILGKLDLAHVEVTDAADFEVFMDDLEDRSEIKCELVQIKHTVGVFRCVLERTMSKKSAAVGTGAIALSPLVDILTTLRYY